MVNKVFLMIVLILQN